MCETAQTGVHPAETQSTQAQQTINAWVPVPLGLPANAYCVHEGHDWVLQWDQCCRPHEPAVASQQT
jgi:hypothetical protein